MKNVFTLLLIIHSAIPGFAEGKSEIVSPSITLNVLAYADGGSYSSEDWVRIVTAFEKENPDIKIQYQLYYKDTYHKKVRKLLAEGKIPDLAFMGFNSLWEDPWNLADVSLDLRPYIDTDHFDTELIQKSQYGKNWFIPNSTANLCSILYANEKLIKELGFELPKTYEDITAMVPAAKTRNIDVISFGGSTSWVLSTCMLSIFAARFTGDTRFISKAVAGDKSFSDPGFIQSLEFLRAMVKDGVISRKMIKKHNSEAAAHYSNGNALFLASGQWDFNLIEDPDVLNATTLIAWPKLPGEKPETAGTIAAISYPGLGITSLASEEKRKAGMKFIQFYNSYEEVEKKRTISLFPGHVLKDQNRWGISHLKIEREKLIRAAAITEVIDNFLKGLANEILETGLQNIVLGSADPEEVAAAVDAAAGNQDPSLIQH